MIEKIRMGTGICVSVLTLLVILFILPRHLMAWWQYELLLLVLLPLSIVAGLKFEMKAHWIRLAHISGNLSYPLYLIHLPVMFFLSAVLKTAGVENGLVWYGIIILPITMVCAYMLYLFYDLPVRSWLGRRLQSLDLKRAV